MPTEHDPLLLGEPGSHQHEGYEGDENLLNDLVDKEIRNGFIKKVYGILSVQIIVTILLAIPFHRVPELKEFVVSNPAVIWVAWGFVLVFLIILTCFPGAAQHYPNNYLLLGAFTIVEALLIGIYTALHDTHAVLIAAGVTCIITIVLTIYAMTTKTDFTGYGIYLLVALLAIFLLSIISVILGIPYLQTLWCILVVVLFSCYIVYDTQLICGGKHQQFAFTVDDYVLAALCLYLDILNVFIYMLAAISGD